MGQTYVLVETRVVKVHRVGPCVLVPDVVRIDVEPTGKDAFLQAPVSEFVCCISYNIYRAACVSSFVYV